jgi:hypothetical protein
VLVREYQGERHTVTVVPGGYVWRENTYASLSTIARAITGTAWNVPRYPSRPITMIIPFPPGSGTDVVARIMA